MKPYLFKHCKNDRYMVCGPYAGGIAAQRVSKAGKISKGYTLVITTVDHTRIECNLPKYYKTRLGAYLGGLYAILLLSLIFGFPMKNQGRWI